MLVFWPWSYHSKFSWTMWLQIKDIWTLIPPIYTELRSASADLGSLACGATFWEFENACFHRRFALPGTMFQKGKNVNVSNILPIFPGPQRKLGNQIARISRVTGPIKTDLEYVQDHMQVWNISCSVFPGSQMNTRNPISNSPTSTRNDGHFVVRLIVF